MYRVFLLGATWGLHGYFWWKTCLRYALKEPQIFPPFLCSFQFLQAPAVQKERVDCVVPWKSLCLRQRALNAAALQFQSPQGTRAVISEHPGALSIFGAMPLHYLWILLAVLKVLLKPDLHRHFAMQLPLELVFQEVRATFFMEMFLLCYLHKGSGLHFLNISQQRGCNQSWPDPTYSHMWKSSWVQQRVRLSGK